MPLLIGFSIIANQTTIVKPIINFLLLFGLLSIAFCILMQRPVTETYNRRGLNNNTRAWITKLKLSARFPKLGMQLWKDLIYSGFYIAQLMSSS